jgi:4-diphosphocytidyl-2-C-methyl-D-erythritol kinase
VGGAVFGENRGEVVSEAPAVTVDGGAEIPCVIALPGHGVSTPQAFRDWDALLAASSSGDLHNSPVRDTLEKLSRTYASVFGVPDQGKKQSGASGIFPEPSSGDDQNSPENLQGTSGEQLHPGTLLTDKRGGFEDDLAENTLLALVRTGIENDFETVVFPQDPSLREIKRQLMGFSDDGNAALYAALSGSGSALFGLYRTEAHAHAARLRLAELQVAQPGLQQHGVEALVTKTLPRPLYWSEMFAE